jgi:hypothetical protein
MLTWGVHPLQVQEFVRYLHDEIICTAGPQDAARREAIRFIQDLTSFSSWEILFPYDSTAPLRLCLNADDPAARERHLSGLCAVSPALWRLLRITIDHSVVIPAAVTSVRTWRPVSLPPVLTLLLDCAVHENERCDH